MLTGVAIIDIVIAVYYQQGMWVSQFIRVFLIVIFIRALREAIKRITLVIYDSIGILMMVTSHIIFFGWLGFRLFRGTQEGEAYFSTLEESIWSLMILLTTANFPDVMLPAYTVNKAYCLFFIFYLVFGLYFLLYLILAIYYSNYKNRIEKNLMKYEDIRKRYLFKKFDSYDHGNKGYLNRKELREMLGVIIKVKKKDMIRIVKNFQQR